MASKSSQRPAQWRRPCRGISDSANHQSRGRGQPRIDDSKQRGSSLTPLRCLRKPEVEVKASADGRTRCRRHRIQPREIRPPRRAARWPGVASLNRPGRRRRASRIWASRSWPWARASLRFGSAIARGGITIPKQPLRRRDPDLQGRLDQLDDRHVRSEHRQPVAARLRRLQVGRSRRGQNRHRECHRSGGDG